MRQSIIRLVMTSHLLLELLRCIGYFLNLLLQRRVDFFSFIDLLLEMLLVLLDHLVHLLNLIRALLQPCLERLNLVPDTFKLSLCVTELSLRVIELQDKGLVCFLLLEKKITDFAFLDLFLFDLVQHSRDVLLDLTKFGLKG